MNRAFGDSWYFFALLNPGDEAHEEAVSFARQWRGKIVTPRWVLCELADGFALDPRLRRLAVQFIAHCEEHPFVLIEEVSESQYAAGFELYKQRPDKQWSLTDCISFAVMAAAGIREALTGDRHFRQAGLIPIFAA